MPGIPVPDRPTAERIAPWCKGLPRDIARVVVLEAGLETPVAEIPIGVDETRDEFVGTVATMLDGITDSADKVLSLTLYAEGSDGRRRTRLILRTKPRGGDTTTAVTSPEFTTDPMQFVRVAIDHTERVMTMWMGSNESMLKTYKDTVEALSEQLAQERTRRFDAEDKAHQLGQLADEAVNKADAAERDAEPLKVVKEGLLAAIVEKAVEKFLPMMGSIVQDGSAAGKVGAAMVEAVGEHVTGKAIPPTPASEVIDATDAVAVVDDAG